MPVQCLGGMPKRSVSLPSSLPNYVHGSRKMECGEMKNCQMHIYREGDERRVVWLVEMS